MSKRRRKKPNLPQETLDKVREETGLPVEADEIDEADEEAVVEAVASPKANPTPKSDMQAQVSAAQRRRKRAVGAAQLDKRKASGNLNPNYIADMLEHPTKVVSEDELHQEYGYVLKDLRNMAVLAAGLFVLLIIISVTIL